MFYAIKTFLTETSVVILDDEKEPITFYRIRQEDVNLGDIYCARITQKLPEIKSFFADIGLGRSVFLSSKKALEIGQKVFLIISKEERTDKVAAAKRTSLEGESPFNHPIGLIRKGSFLAGTINSNDFNEIEWQAEFDELYEESVNTFVPFGNGARLIFETTHAFNSIDVDSHTSLEPIDILNEKAASVIAKEIIKRNLSGNILIDFIGKKQKSVIGNLKNIMASELAKSPVPFQVFGVSPIGNVELRRTRMRASLLNASQTLSAKSFNLFRQILTEKAQIKNIQVSLSLYAYLNANLFDTWQVVLKKIGYHVPLRASTEVSTYFIEYR